MKCILSVGLVLFGLGVFAQCKGFAKSCKKELSKTFMPTGQSANKELLPGERYQYITTFYSGQSYRVSACSDSILGDLQLTIRNTRRQLFYDNNGNESKTFDFKVGTTQQLIITLKAPENNNSLEDVKGCVATLIGVKLK